MKKLVAVIVLISIATVVISQTNYNNTALDSLVSKAKQANSSALVVYVDGKIIYNQYFDTTEKVFDAMSATKSVVSLGIGLLLTDGKIKSIDEPVYTFYPEWKQGKKKNITIRHLLNHTSGLQCDVNTGGEIYPAPDFVQQALAAELSTDPGTDFFYNNKAVNLLAGIIKKASDERMDAYIKRKIFEPLGITSAYWITDSALYIMRQTGKEDTSYLSKGNPIGMAELMISPEDFLKIGILVLQKGNWQGKQIINASYLDESVQPSQPFNQTCGLLWWLIPANPAIYQIDESFIQKLQKQKVSDSIVQVFKQIKGEYTWAILKDKLAVNSMVKAMGGYAAFAEKLLSFNIFLRVNACKIKIDSVVGFSARGYMGQYLVIYPEKKIVVVRMLAPHRYTSDKDNFSDIDEWVGKLR